MAEKLDRFNPFEAIRRYTNIIDNTEKMNQGDYIDKILQQIANEHPEYFGEKTNQQETINGISLLFKEKMKKLENIKQSVTPQ